MPSITKQDANDAIARAIGALSDVNFDVFKRADDEQVEGFVQALREYHERYENDMDVWIADY